MTSDSDLVALALGERDLPAFTDHLAGCEGCTIFVDQIRMTIRLAGESTDERLDVMPAGLDRLLAELRNRALG